MSVLAMPNFDAVHKAISTRITALQYLKKMSSAELIADSGLSKDEFKLMEFCYNPQNAESRAKMVTWLKANDSILRQYYGTSYHTMFPPLD